MKALLKSALVDVAIPALLRVKRSCTPPPTRALLKSALIPPYQSALIPPYQSAFQKRSHTPPYQSAFLACFLILSLAKPMPALFLKALS